MKIGMVGLGRMGANMARRIMASGHECVANDISKDAVAALEKDGAIPAYALEELVEKLGDSPRTVWVMLPAGHIVENTIEKLSTLLGKGDIIIDGGNSYYKDGIRRGKMLEQKGIDLIDCGTSGGVFGLERGFCMMVGGSDRAVKHIDPILAALAPGLGDVERTPNRKSGDPRVENGYMHAGPTGAGHFTKMVHNGIEYGMMQAYAEGLDIIRNKASEDLPEDERFDIKVDDVAEVWRRGSVISSWLLDLTADALAKDEKLSDFSGSVPDSGEGRWTIEAAMEEAVPAEVLTSALYTRFRSRREHTFAEKVVSAMRHGFGGHTEVQPDVNKASLKED